MKRFLMRGSSEFNLTSILLWKNLHSTVICINHPKICFFSFVNYLKKIHRHKKVTMRKQKEKFNDLQIGSSRLCNFPAVIRAGVRVFTFSTFLYIEPSSSTILCLSAVYQQQNNSNCPFTKVFSTAAPYLLAFHFSLCSLVNIS